MKKFLIYGYGISGRAVAEYFKRHSIEFYIVDKNDQGLENSFTVKDFDRFSEIFKVVISPGISKEDEFYKKIILNNIEIVSEIELAYNLLKEDSIFIAVTGTNGKSTTVSLLQYMLKKKYRDVFLTGNIGDPLINYSEHKGKKIFIVEMSSYQLESLKHFTPHIAILLNLTPDHLERHKSMINYKNAKQNIFSNMDQGYVLYEESFDVNNSDTTNYMYEKDFYFNGKEYKDNENNIIKGLKTKLFGNHNNQNISFCIKSCLLMNIEDKQIKEALSEYNGLEHRIEFVREIENISIYNDSKSTTFESTYAAVEAFEKNVYLLVSGSSKKGMDFQKFSENLGKYEQIKEIIVLGSISEEFNNIVGSRFKLYNTYEWDKIFQNFVDDHRKEDCVLLFSPGMPSFDNFKNFEHRGEFFKNQIQVVK